MKLISHGAYLVDNKRILDCQSPENQQEISTLKLSEAKKGTMAYKILSEHSQKGQSNELNIIFDSLTSHDITYVGIIQTATRAMAPWARWA